MNEENINQESIMLSKISQAEKDKHHMVLLIHEIFNERKNQTHKNRKQKSDFQGPAGRIGRGQ